MAKELFRALLTALLCAFGALCLAAVTELLFWQLDAAVARQPSSCQPSALVIALDRSGSMIEGYDKMQAVQDGLNQFLGEATGDLCATSTFVGLVSFNREAQVEVVPTSDLSEVGAAISGVVAEGGTVIENGINSATAALEDAAFDDARKVMLLITDADNYNSDGDQLEQALEQAVASRVDVRAVVTESGPHVQVLSDTLGPEKVVRTTDEALGTTVLREAEGAVLDTPLDLQEPLVGRNLFFIVWTGMVTLGVMIGFFTFSNWWHHQTPLLQGRRWLALLASFLLAVIGCSAVRYGFLLLGPPIAETFAVDAGGRYAYWATPWIIVGLFLPLVLTWVRAWHAKGPGFLVLAGLSSGVLGGLSYAALLQAGPQTADPTLRLFGALVVGACLGFALAACRISTVQPRLWLQVYYLSDRVYRYYPMTARPITVGSSEEADIFLYGDYDVLWLFWIEDGRVSVRNVASDKTSSMRASEAVARGPLELKGMNIKIVSKSGSDLDEPAEGRAADVFDHTAQD